MANLSGFASRMKIIAEKVDRNINKNIRAMALIIDRDVVFGTPVDTGRARSNWLTSVNFPLNTVIEAYSKGKGLGIGENQNAQAAIAQAAAAVGRRKSEQPIYISNNLDYIGDLNNGTSAQAPKAFVQTAIASGLAFWRRQKTLK